MLAALGLLGSAALPVLAQSRTVLDQGRAASIVETGFAMPRLGSQPHWRNDEIGIVHPLSAVDQARIRQIFDWQASSQFEPAAQATRSLQSDILLGDILADRYLRVMQSSDARLDPARPDAAMLRAWLQRWSGQPDTGAIRHLLSDLTRGKASATPPPPHLDPDQPQAPPPEEADPAEQAFRRNPVLDRTIQAMLSDGEAGARRALRLVEQSRFNDVRYAALLRAEIAQALFTEGDDARAERTGRIALAQSGGQIGLAGYVAGLAAWRQGDIEAARGLFEQASRGALTAASTRAGAAFWAARAHRRLHDDAGWRPWLVRAAAESHTFYGMLADRTLSASQQPVGLDTIDFKLSPDAPAPGTPVLGEADLAAVAATPEGGRAFALLQVGQRVRAEAALRQLWPRVQGDVAMCRSISLVAQTAGMTELAAQTATLMQSRRGMPLDNARFPIPRLRPRQGFTVNPALVYALTRLESNFDNRAVSGAGAHGLMQIMPVTANFMLGSGHRLGTAQALHNPGVNLEIGQRYLTYLSGLNSVDGDLIRLLASYNAGPGALADWSDGAASPATRDPLLFIEALPARETRDFVHRALCYLWIYAGRMELAAPSLDTLAQGGWPRFGDEQKMASSRPENLEAAR